MGHLTVNHVLLVTQSANIYAYEGMESVSNGDVENENAFHHDEGLAIAETPCIDLGINRNDIV